MSKAQWVQGDTLGLLIPANIEALQEGGAEFLTRAFRASGVLSLDNQVARITQFEECRGGSTGRKLFLSVEYAQATTALPMALFVKFSRDFDDEIRDRAKNQLDAEVRLALLSRSPGFPLAVPLCLFADYQKETGTGILITEQIAFGKGAIERLYEKCLDTEMPEPLEHYAALMKALGSLAGTYRGGGLAADVSVLFPFDAEAAQASDRIRYNEQQLLNRLKRYADFSASHPQFLPANITTAAFIAQMQRDIPRFLQYESAIRLFLYGKPEFIALCHWNANVDNAWFWRDDQDELQCGLMDWGRVGQMSIALALWGALSAAEVELWDQHLEELLAHFVAEFQGHGGPDLDLDELKNHLFLFVALMGLAWLMDAPALIQKQIPQMASIQDRFDPRFRFNESARVQLQMMSNVLNLWQTRDFGSVLDRLIEQSF